VPECPVEAIFLDENVPEQWKHYIELNAEMAPKCEVITEKMVERTREERKARGRTEWQEEI
jgi:hypothetical protein